MLHTATSLSARVANASNKRLTRFELSYTGERPRMVCAAQVANCVQVVATYTLALLHGGTRALSVRSEACVARRPTYSLPPGRRRNIRRGTLRRGRAKRVRRTVRALATNMSHVVVV